MFFIIQFSYLLNKIKKHPNYLFQNSPTTSAATLRVILFYNRTRVFDCAQINLVPILFPQICMTSIPASNGANRVAHQVIAISHLSTPSATRHSTPSTTIFAMMSSSSS
jgi:hypothetical protein